MSQAVSAPLLAQLVDQLFSAARARTTTPANEVLPRIVLGAPITYPARTEAEEAECVAIDMAMHRDKLNDGYAKRHQAGAVRLQMKSHSGAFE